MTLDDDEIPKGACLTSHKGTDNALKTLMEDDIKKYPMRKAAQARRIQKEDAMCAEYS